jgi:Holliday junction resolvase RusA-like endonuclease
MKRKITLPYPDRSLNPNRKSGRHWATTKKVKDEAFETAFYAARVCYASVTVPDEPIALTITYVRKDKRYVDLDNLLSASKSILDGIAQGMRIDDKRFEPITIKRGYDKEGSYMVVELG